MENMLQGACEVGGFNSGCRPWLSALEQQGSTQEPVFRFFH